MPSSARSAPDELIQNASFAVGVRHNEASSSSKTIWNASARYDFMPGLYAQTNFGTTFLLPAAEQLYAIDPFSTLGSEPGAEEAENFNIGLGGEFNAGPALTLASHLLQPRHRQPHPVRADCDDSDPDTDCSILYPDLDPSYYNEGFYINLPGTVEVRGFELVGTANFGNGFLRPSPATPTPRRKTLPATSSPAFRAHTARSAPATMQISGALTATCSGLAK